MFELFIMGCNDHSMLSSEAVAMLMINVKMFDRYFFVGVFFANILFLFRDLKISSCSGLFMLAHKQRGILINISNLSWQNLQKES